MTQVVELSRDEAMNRLPSKEQGADSPPRRTPRREHRLTVQESGNLYRIKHGYEQSKPALRLCGAWLAKAGFRPGAQVRVRVEDGRIVIEA